jgi:arsenite-transporting ATPase
MRKKIEVRTSSFLRFPSSFSFFLLPSHSPQFTFFGGKGGVGKTTCAAARAVAAAKSGRVLVVSTDPAHSLGDALGVRLSARVSPVRLRGRQLWAVELDGPRAFQRWLVDHRRALGDIVEHGTWLDREDVDALLGLSIPGVDELIAMVEIVRLAQTGAAAERESLRSSVRSLARGGGAPPAVKNGYDLVIVDTAPTGHTLRLLAAPETVGAVADVLNALQAEHRLIREQLARVGRPEAADRLIALVAEQAHDTGELLRDARRSAFYWVMLPEDLSLFESADALAALDRSRIPVAEVIVNCVIPDGPACPICDRLRADERRVIARIPRRLGAKRRLRFVPEAVGEPRGVDELAKIGKYLWGPVTRGRWAKAFARSHSLFGDARGDREHVEVSGGRPNGRAALARATPTRPSRSEPRDLARAARGDLGVCLAAPESIDAFDGARMLLFGGKGGVGKTTTAAATALRLARGDSTRRVLLMSTDPAHSLGDVLGAAVGDRPAAIRGAPKNLRVRELDAAAALGARRLALEAALNEIVAAFGAKEGVDSIRGGRGVGELIDLAPPGIDELLGVLAVADLLPSETHGEFDLIILDTAPTGHALRLLEMPDAAREWVRVLLRMLLKYRTLVRPGQLAAELVELSKSIRRLQALLHDARQARFIVVTRAAEMPRFETERLIARLRRLRLAAPAVIVNALTLAPGRCLRCRAIAVAEQRQLALLERGCRQRLRECAIILTPLAAPPPRGVAALDRWARTWVRRR